MTAQKAPARMAGAFSLSSSVESAGGLHSSGMTHPPASAGGLYGGLYGDPSCPGTAHRWFSPILVARPVPWDLQSRMPRIRALVPEVGQDRRHERHPLPLLPRQPHDLVLPVVAVVDRGLFQVQPRLEHAESRPGRAYSPRAGPACGRIWRLQSERRRPATWLRLDLCRLGNLPGADALRLADGPSPAARPKPHGWRTRVPGNLAARLPAGQRDHHAAAARRSGRGRRRGSAQCPRR